MDDSCGGGCSSVGCDSGFSSGGCDSGCLSEGYDSGFSSGGYYSGCLSGGYDSGFSSGGCDSGCFSGEYDAGFSNVGCDAGSSSGGCDAGFSSGGCDAGLSSGGCDAGFSSGGVDGSLFNPLGCPIVKGISYGNAGYMMSSAPLISSYNWNGGFENYNKSYMTNFKGVHTVYLSPTVTNVAEESFVVYQPARQWSNCGHPMLKVAIAFFVFLVLLGIIIQVVLTTSRGT